MTCNTCCLSHFQKKTISIAAISRLHTLVPISMQISHVFLLSSLKPFQHNLMRSGNKTRNADVCSVTQVVYLAEGIEVLDDFEVWRWITRTTLPAKADRKCEYMSTSLAQIYSIVHAPGRRLNTPQ